MPDDFGVSARLGTGPHFVVEADEYDSAFFDKRAKFVHYRPRIAILNNLEYDHADIYPDLASIRTQFHHLVRTVPSTGRLIVRADDPELEATLALGAWTPIERFGRGAHASYRLEAITADWSQFTVLEQGALLGRARSPLLGAHNAENALAACLAARQAGIPLERSLAALADFQGVRRRLELRGTVRGVNVYDDFAHHPTAIANTLAGLRARVGRERILAVLEPRSNTMKLGVHKDTLAPSLAGADLVYLYRPANLGWDLSGVAAGLGARAVLAADLEQLTRALSAEARAGDHILIMSNGGFGGLHERLLAALAGPS
jgi:UDP-N-acetylmuramate: L-alanyl-gamma-D-glutamyl-meso-diaminopimelate ligase